RIRRRPHGPPDDGGVRDPAQVPRDHQEGRSYVERILCEEALKHVAERRTTMRVMVIVKATKNSEAGILPGDPRAPLGYEKLFAEMGKYNEELVKAGVMLAGEGLHPSSKGKRVNF